MSPGVVVGGGGDGGSGVGGEGHGEPPHMNSTCGYMFTNGSQQGRGGVGMSLKLPRHSLVAAVLKTFQ